MMLCIESSGHFRKKKDACSLLHTLPHLMITSRRDTGLSDCLYALWIIIFLDGLRHRSWYVKTGQTSQIECKHAALRMTALVMWLVIWWCKHKGLWRERPEEFSDRSGAVPTERDREWDYLCSEKVYLPLSACPCGVLVLVIKSWQKNSSSNKKTVVNASSVSMYMNKLEPSAIFKLFLTPKNIFCLVASLFEHINETVADHPYDLTIFPNYCMVYKNPQLRLINWAWDV